MKDNLIGALRREKIAETALQKSEAEIERIDCLVSFATNTVQFHILKGYIFDRCISLCKQNRF